MTIYTDASKTGLGITDGHNPSGGPLAEHERMHINVLELKAAFIEIPTYCHNRSNKHIRKLCQTALQQLHILIIKVLSSPKSAMELQRKYGYGVLKVNFSSLQLTYEENAILKQIGFPENLTIIQNGNLILRYLLKILISLAIQKLIFLLPA